MFKGLDKNFKGLNFQYEVGKTYKTEKAVMCLDGFHACHKPLQTFKFYPPRKQCRYAVVDMPEIVDTDHDGKAVSHTITIKHELSLAEIIKLADADSLVTKQNYESAIAKSESNVAHARGAYSAAMTKLRESVAVVSDVNSVAMACGYGSASVAAHAQCLAVTEKADSAAVAMADYSKAEARGLSSVALASRRAGESLAKRRSSAAVAAGEFSTATATGQESVACGTRYLAVANTSGSKSAAVCTGRASHAKAEKQAWLAATTGDFGTACSTTNKGVVVAAGRDSKAKGTTAGTVLILVNRDESGVPRHVKTLIVGKNGIKPNVWYYINSSGKVCHD